MGSVVDGLLQQRICSVCRFGRLGVPSGYDPTISCGGACLHCLPCYFISNQVFDQFDEILKYCNELSMTIELDSTLAQAEVLFLSFAQLVADIDRRRAEEVTDSTSSVLRRRGTSASEGNASLSKVAMPTLSDNLRDLLKTGR
jgi:hypothetical protein